MVLRFRYGACGLCLSLDNGDWGLLAKRREVKHPSDPSAAALTARRLLKHWQLTPKAKKISFGTPAEIFTNSR
jgi:hypothetical protein